jgi:hypothetical protein
MRQTALPTEPPSRLADGEDIESTERVVLEMRSNMGGDGSTLLRDCIWPAWLIRKPIFTVEDILFTFQEQIVCP